MQQYVFNCEDIKGVFEMSTKLPAVIRGKFETHVAWQRDNLTGGGRLSSTEKYGLHVMAIYFSFEKFTDLFYFVLISLY